MGLCEPAGSGMVAVTVPSVGSMRASVPAVSVISHDPTGTPW